MMQIDVENSIREFTIEHTIMSHPAWYGDIAGLDSEALLKERPVYSYLLRAGERSFHYYISFMDQDLLIRHQPFAIIHSGNAWYCRQGILYGPFITQTITDLIHRIMHCNPEDCKPAISTS